MFAIGGNIKMIKKVWKILRNLHLIPLYLFFHYKGINRAYWRRLYTEFKYDFFSMKTIRFKDKMWAYRKGFLSERIIRYGLNKDNYQDYMSDFQYAKKVSCVNGRFYYWFDDKLTTWYVLRPFREYLPIHYYSIHKNNILELYPEGNQFNNSVEGVLELLKRKKELAFKEVIGAGGAGFFKVVYDNEYIMVNKKRMTQEEFCDFVKSLDGYMATEYVYAHSDLRKIYKNSPNALRIITIYDKEKGTKITGSFIRFGTSDTGYVDNACAGGICSGVEINNGEIFNPRRFIDNKIEMCHIHPETGEDIAGTIPNWHIITEKVIEIGNYLNSTPHLTFDIAVTQDAFKILEINSHGQVRNLQLFYPFYKNEFQAKLFRSQ